jgi:hypothetical protein
MYPYFNPEEKKYVRKYDKFGPLSGMYCKWTLENTEGAMKKGTIQRNFQQDQEKQQETQHNMCCIPLYANKHK